MFVLCPKCDYLISVRPGKDAAPPICPSCGGTGVTKLAAPLSPLKSNQAAGEPHTKSSEDRAAHYEARVSNAIGEGKAAVAGTARGVWRSLPEWLRNVIQLAIFGPLFFFGALGLFWLIARTLDI